MHNVKLKYTDINVIKAICGNPTLPLKWKLDLFTLKGVCVKIQKIIRCKTKLSHVLICHDGT